MSSVRRRSWSRGWLLVAGVALAAGLVALAVPGPTGATTPFSNFRDCSTPGSCVALTPSVIYRTHPDGAGCDEMDVMTVSVPQNLPIVKVEVLYTKTVLPSYPRTVEPILSGPPSMAPGTNPIHMGTVSYTVPTGSVGFYLAFGGGPGPCSDNSGDFTDIQAVGVLGCSGSVNGTRALATATTQDDQACPLAVHITGPVENGQLTAHAGLAYPQHAFFSGGSCLSGCTDLTITVTDPTKNDMPVPGASVIVDAAALSPTQMAPYPRFLGTGLSHLNPQNIRTTSARAYLCKEGPPTSPVCGASLPFTSDGSGQVKVRLWVPGVVPDVTGLTAGYDPIVSGQNESVQVTARATCDPANGCSTSSSTSGCGCSLKGTRHGEQTKSVTIKPNVVIGTVKLINGVYVGIPRVATLTDTELFYLEEWAKQGGAGDVLVDKGQSELIDKVIELLFAEESVPANVPKALDWIAGHSPGDQDRETFVGIVLEHFGVGESGLGLTSTDTSANVFPPLADPFFLGPFGDMVKDFGNAVDALGGQVNPPIRLAVYEVSYCDEGRQCGPDYSCSSTLRCGGIQPYLDFQFYSYAPTGTFGPHKVYSDNLVVPYRADSWMDGQKNIPAPRGTGG